MKKLAFFILALAFGLGLQAQANFDPVQLATEKTQNLKEIVNLTSEQESEVLDINNTKLAELQNYQEQNNRLAIISTRKTRRQAVLEVLTTAQMATLRQAAASSNERLNI